MEVHGALTSDVRWCVDVLGVRVDGVTLAEATRRAVELVQAARSERRARLIFTPNPEIIARASRDEALRNVLNSADLSVADGVGVVWASRLLGPALPERVPGVELLTCLLQEAPRGLRVFFLGARPGVASRAAAAAASRFPAIVVAGEHHGYFTDDQEVLARIRQAEPDLLVVGMGSPKQETWLAEHRQRLGGTAAIGVGGALDLLAGRTRRAPAWVRRLNIEWLYRILSQPAARLGRVPALGRFLLAVTAEAAAGSRRRRNGGGRL